MSKTRKKPGKKPRTRGQRPRGQDVVTFTARLEREVIEWLDGMARDQGISRTAVLGQLLRYSKSAAEGMEKAGLFDDLESNIVRAVEQAIAGLERSPLRKGDR